MLKDKNYDDSKYAWPGGYTYIWYFQHMNETILICYECAQKAFKLIEDETKEDFPFFSYKFIGQDIHWEGESLFCDDCGVEMESEYGIPED